MLNLFLEALDGNKESAEKAKSIMHANEFNNCYFCGPTKKEVSLTKFNNGGNLFSGTCCTPCFFERFYC